MNSEYRPTKVDLFILLSFFVLGVLSIMGLRDSSMYLNYFPQSGAFDHFKLGNIVKTQNDVKLKSISEIHWRQAALKTEVYNKQMIFTNKDSSSLIQLDNGSQIEVGPESLITLVKEGARDTLQIKSGTLSGIFKGVNVVYKGKKVKISSNNSRVSVANGKLKVATKDAKANIYAPQKLKLIEKQSATGAIELVGPEKKVFLVSDSENVIFKWSSKEVKRFDLVLIKSHEGKIKVQKIKGLDKNSIRLRFKAEGHYSLSAQDSDTETIVSNKVDFKVIPRPDATISIKEKLIERRL
ncbi:MAG: hypothetical protein WD025_00215 [Bacteriovoracaceae bacterium]